MERKKKKKKKNSHWGSAEDITELAFIIPSNVARRARFAPGSHRTRQTGSRGHAAVVVPSRESAHGLFYGDRDPVTRGTGSLGFCLSALYPETQRAVCLRASIQTDGGDEEVDGGKRGCSTCQA